jgi:rsbT antagonist protein RsbS
MEQIPILMVGDCLLVSIQVDMHDKLAVDLQDRLTEKIVGTGARGLMIDISALQFVDSFIGRLFNNIASMARVLDAVTVIVGMQPAVAITLVEIGLTMSGIRTALNVDKGLALIRRIIDDGEDRFERREG